MVFRMESSRLSQPGSALTAAALYFLIVATILNKCLTDRNAIELMMEVVMMECDVPFQLSSQRGLYTLPVILIIASCYSDVAFISVLPILDAVAKQSGRPCYRSIIGWRGLPCEKSYDLLGVTPSITWIPDPEISAYVLSYAVSNVRCSHSGFGLCSSPGHGPGFAWCFRTHLFV